jgi:hypothetical protein
METLPSKTQAITDLLKILKENLVAGELREPLPNAGDTFNKKYLSYNIILHEDAITLGEVNSPTGYYHECRRFTTYKAEQQRNAPRMAALEKALAAAREALEGGLLDWFQVSHDTVRGCYVVNGVEFPYKVRRVPPKDTVVKWSTSDGVLKVGFVASDWGLEKDQTLKVVVRTSSENIYSYISDWVEFVERQEVPEVEATKVPKGKKG